MTDIDIKENNLYRLDSRLLDILLADRTTKKNLIWATDNYSSRGPGYKASDNINVYAIIKRNGSIIKPRVEKSKKEQADRVKSKAEVFTDRNTNRTKMSWSGLQFSNFSKSKQKYNQKFDEAYISVFSIGTEDYYAEHNELLEDSEIATIESMLESME